MYGHPTAVSEWQRSTRRSKPMVRAGFLFALGYVAVLGLSFVIQIGGVL